MPIPIRGRLFLRIRGLVRPISLLASSSVSGCWILGRPKSLAVSPLLIWQIAQCECDDSSRWISINSELLTTEDTGFACHHASFPPLSLRQAGEWLLQRSGGGEACWKNLRIRWAQKPFRSEIFVWIIPMQSINLNFKFTQLNRCLCKQGTNFEWTRIQQNWPQQTKGR